MYKKKLAVITTHPIQYNAPLFRLMNQRKQIELKVFYTWSQSKDEVFDARFGIKRSWDIPLLDGYDAVFVHNTSKHPDSNRFLGIINPELIQMIKDYQPDAVLVYRWSVYSHLKVMQTFGGSRTQLFFRGDSHLQNKTKGAKDFLRSILLRFVYRKVDAAFYVGSYNKNYFLKYGLKESQLKYAPHAVDNRRFADNQAIWEEKALTERRELQIPDDAVAFLYAGKFYELKQLDVLVDAFKQLKGDQYRLLLYGSGEQEGLLKQLAAGNNRIYFLPFRNQSDMPWVYRTGNVFVLPSKSETWGLGVNEAMACGRPAIVSNKCGCAPELIKEGETGYSFEAGDSHQLLNRLQQFSNIAVAKKMGMNALEHIKDFSLEKIAEAVETAIV
jgi:glycosyltransferase involved in cell wall biosynthesis